MAESIPKILTDDDLYGSINQQSSRKEISEHFADVAEYLLNRNLIVIGEERYRITAVEFYLFSPQHTDFVSFLFLGNRHYEETHYLFKSIYAIVLPLVKKDHWGYYIYEWSSGMYRLKESSCFGKVVITDVANLEDDVSVPIKQLIAEKAYSDNEWNRYSNELLFTYKDAYFNRIQDYGLPPVNIVRRIREIELVQFDDVYECVNRIRKTVKTGFYSREEIVESLMSFRNRRYRFERYVTRENVNKHGLK